LTAVEDIRLFFKVSKILFITEENRSRIIYNSPSITNMQAMIENIKALDLSNIDIH